MKDQIAAVLIARSLQEQIPHRSRARLDWRARLRLHDDERLAHLGSAERKALAAAMSRAEPPLVDRIVGIVAGASFVAMSEASRIEWLEALTKTRLSAAILDAMEALLTLLAVGVDASVRRSLVRELMRRPATSGRAIRALATSEGFSRLDVVEQLELVRYLAGPRVPAARRAYLDEAWDARRIELAELLECEQRGGRADAAMERLRDFLYLPHEALYVLESKSYLGRSIVIVGDPRGPTALSYGEITTLRITGDRVAKIESPDRCVASGWREGGDDAQTTYAFRRLDINRDEARRLVEWAERVYDSGPKDALGFVAGAERVADLMTGAADDKRAGLMQLGRELQRPATQAIDREIDRLMRGFLAA